MKKKFGDYFFISYRENVKKKRVIILSYYEVPALTAPQQTGTVIPVTQPQ